MSWTKRHIFPFCTRAFEFAQVDPAFISLSAGQHPTYGWIIVVLDLIGASQTSIRDPRVFLGLFERLFIASATLQAREEGDLPMNLNAIA